MSDYSKDYLVCQEAESSIGSVGLPEQEDQRFNWKRERQDALQLADLYKAAEINPYSDRVKGCASWLMFDVGGEALDKLHLRWANFCKLRLCPICTARKARKNAVQLSKVLNQTEVDHLGVQYLFLTLTIQNVFGGEALGQAIKDLHAGWRRLLDLRRWERAIKGWYRADEITRNNEWGSPWYGSYHPHIHAILAVDEEYFKSLQYLQQPELVQMWRKAMRLPYDPRVDIRATRDKRSVADTDKASITATYEASKRPAKEKDYIPSASAAAAAEAAKYATKSIDYLHGKGPHRMTFEEQTQVVKDYTSALAHKRMMALGGWLKEAAGKLNCKLEEDDDLIHIGDDELREDIAKYLYIYHWHFGAGDYVLEQVIPCESTGK